MRQSLHCYVLSRSALPLARRLADLLAASPWPAPIVYGGTAGMEHAAAQQAATSAVACCRLFAPARLSASDTSPFTELGSLLAQEYRHARAHVFIGAAGIAVRVLAPLLRHKSEDPPVVVLDAAGCFAVSLLSGHWGGGNALARHLAQLLGAQAVITTASDTAARAVFTEPPPTEATPTAAAVPASETATDVAKPTALDEMLRDAGVRILDWPRLPRAQAALLEGECLRCWDPEQILPASLATQVAPMAALPLLSHKTAIPAQTEDSPPALAVHWRAIPAAEHLLRLTAPCLHVGLGARRGIPLELAHTAIRELLHQHGIEPRALATLATVTEKGQEPALVYAARCLGLPLRLFAATTLAVCPTPHPSEAAGRRFGQQPFSVCEAAALMAAGAQARLVLPKQRVAGCLTLALAFGLPSDTKSAVCPVQTCAEP